MITKLADFERVQEAKKLISKTAKPKKGKMHKVLGIPEDKEVKDVYKSGKKLASDLVAKVGKKKAAGMLAFAANINKEVDVFDKALKALSGIDESATSDNNSEIEKKQAEISKKMEDIFKKHGMSMLELKTIGDDNEAEIDRLIGEVTAKDAADGKLLSDLSDEWFAEDAKWMNDIAFYKNKSTDINDYSWDELTSYVVKIFPHIACITTNASPEDMQKIWDEFMELENPETNIDGFIVDKGFVAVMGTMDDELKLVM